MNIAILTVATLSLVVSATTLTMVVVGAKKVESSIVEAKERSNSAIRGMKHALDNLEI